MDHLPSMPFCARQLCSYSSLTNFAQRNYLRITQEMNHLKSSWKINDNCYQKKELKTTIYKRPWRLMSC